jgi:drug/metabolite transporter superfamily protein YnfA
MRRANFNIRILAFLMAFLMLLSGCYSSTTIISHPEGATLYLDGKYVGQTPYRRSDSKIMGSSTNVRLEKEGYLPLYTSYSRTERVDVAAIAGGIFVLIPLLWALKYNPFHQYEMNPLQKEDVTAPPVREKSPAEKKAQVKALMEELTGSATEKLRRLKELFDKGLISKEEYDAQRAKILENP